MEIAFFTDPVANTDMKTPAPAACPRQEFSFLLAAMLKSAQPGTVIDSGLLDGGSIPVSEKGEANASMVNSEGLEESGNIVEGGTAELEEPTDALAAAANIFAPVPFAGPVHNTAVTAMQAAPDAPAKAIGNEVPAAAVQKTAFLKIEENEAVAMGIRNIVDSSMAASPQTGNKGKIELSEDLLSSSAPVENFEVEIPAEEILNQVADETMDEPALFAGSRAETGAQSEGRLIEAAPVDVSGTSKEDKPAPVDKSVTAAANEIVQPSASFEGFETSNRDASEEEIGQGAAFETQSVKPEAATAGITFDKAVDHAEKSHAAANTRMTAFTAEVHEKVQAGMKVSIEHNGGEVKMKLNPDSLGEVRIKLNVNEGIVKAEITVDNPEVKRIIEADSSFLRESLGAQGLTLDKCVVEVGRSFDARYRDDADRSQPDFNDQQRPARDKDEDRGNSGWHRHFRRHNTRHEEGGVDFFA